MIENFLRPVRGPADVGADVLRGFGVLSVVLAAIFFDATDAGIVAFALPGLFFPRFMGMKAWADMVFGGTLLVAAWSNVFDLYTSIGWWDLAVHFVWTNPHHNHRAGLVCALGNGRMDRWHLHE